MFQRCRRQRGGLVMPKNRLNTSCDEWSYGRCAHRQDRADKSILRAVVSAQSGKLSCKAFEGSNPCPHQIQNQKIFRFRI
jgi:hypothetical protein